MRHFVLTCVISLLVAACGGATAGTDEDRGVDTSSSDTQSQPSAPDDSDQAQESDPAQEDLPFENGEGFFVVDGERVDPEFVVSCIPFDGSEFGGEASHPDDLAINAIEGSTALEVQVGYQEGVGAGGDRNYDAIRVSPMLLRAGEEGQESFEAGFLTDPDGAWYSSENESTIQLSLGNATGTPLEQAPMVRDGNRISGTVTLAQTWPDGADGTVVVSYDLSFSPEQFDCSTR